MLYEVITRRSGRWRRRTTRPPYFRFLSICSRRSSSWPGPPRRRVDLGEQEGKGKAGNEPPPAVGVGRAERGRGGCRAPSRFHRLCCSPRRVCRTRSHQARRAPSRASSISPSSGPAGFGISPSGSGPCLPARARKDGGESLRPSASGRFDACLERRREPDRDGEWRCEDPRIRGQDWVGRVEAVGIPD